MGQLKIFPLLYHNLDFLIFILSMLELYKRLLQLIQIFLLMLKVQYRNLKKKKETKRKWRADLSKINLLLKIICVIIHLKKLSVQDWELRRSFEKTLTVSFLFFMNMKLHFSKQIIIFIFSIVFMCIIYCVFYCNYKIIFHLELNKYLIYFL